MKKGFITYLHTWLKNVFTLFFPALFATVFLLTTVLLLGGTLLSAQVDKNTDLTLNIGLVGDTQDRLLRVGIFALENMNSDKYTIHFIEYDSEDEAVTHMRQADITSYVVVPEDFTDGINEGTFSPLRYVSTDGAASVGTLLAEEVVAAVSSGLSVSENLIYGMQRTASDAALANPWEYANIMSERILLLMLNRDSFLEVEYVDYGENIGLFGYYLSALPILFLLLWGTFLSPRMAGRSRQLQVLLRTKGCGSLAQVLGEYLGNLILMITILIIPAGISIVLSAAGILPVFELLDGYKLLDSLNLLSLTSGMFFSIALILSLQYLLYEFVTGVIQSVLIQFLGGITLGYVSGCLYPISFFPESVQQVGSILPSGLARRCLAAGFRDDSIAPFIVCMILETLICLCISTLLRQYRLTHA